MNRAEFALPLTDDELMSAIVQRTTLARNLQNGKTFPKLCPRSLSASCARSPRRIDLSSRPPSREGRQRLRRTSIRAERLIVAPDCRRRNPLIAAPDLIWGRGRLMRPFPE